MSKKTHKFTDPGSQPASGSSPPQEVVPFTSLSGNMTKKERQAWLKVVLPVIRKAVEAEYVKRPVLHVGEIDTLCRSAAEEVTNTPTDDHDVLMTGRIRQDNLSDWVKAQHTDEELTVKLTIGGEQDKYRLWTGIAGSINGLHLVTYPHLIAIVEALQAAHERYESDLCLQIGNLRKALTETKAALKKATGKAVA